MELKRYHIMVSMTDIHLLIVPYGIETYIEYNRQNNLFFF